MSILKAIELVSAAFVLAFILLAAAAWLATAILEAKDRRQRQRQKEQPRDRTEWRTVWRQDGGDGLMVFPGRGGDNE